MTTLTLNIKDDNKLDFLLELLNNFDFVQVKEEDGLTKEEVLNDLKQAVKEMNLIKQGKLKATPAKDFLNEL